MPLEFYPFPVVGGHLSDQILGHDLPKHLWDGREVGLVIFVLDAVDEGAELEDILPGTLVVPTQVLRQLLTPTTTRGSTAGGPGQRGGQGWR